VLVLKNLTDKEYCPASRPLEGRPHCVELLVYDEILGILIMCVAI